jgi:hypothetical protein
LTIAKLESLTGKGSESMTEVKYRHEPLQWETPVKTANGYARHQIRISPVLIVDTIQTTYGEGIEINNPRSNYHILVNKIIIWSFHSIVML